MRAGISILICLQFTYSCIDKSEENKEVVRIRIDEFPDTFNPVRSNNSQAEEIFGMVYEYSEKLGDITNDVFPSVAELQSIRDSGDYKFFKYSIRPEAKWDNSRRITSVDIETTFKIVNLPVIDNQWIRLVLSFIKGVRLFDGDPSSFEINCYR